MALASKGNYRPAEIAAQKQRIVDHLEAFCKTFNEAAKSQKLDVVLDAEEASAYVRNLPWVELAVMEGMIKAGQIHQPQIQTAVDSISRMVNEPGRSGLVLGALQSGKTGTAFGMLFAAPIQYLVNGLKFAPLFVTTSQDSHYDQTKQSLVGFLKLYGNLRISRVGDFDEDKASDLVSFFAGLTTQEAREELSDIDDAISINTYSAGMLKEIYGQTPSSDLAGIIAEAMMVKRVGGRSVNEIKKFVQRADDHGYGVMMLVDEPQWGASDTRDNTFGSSADADINDLISDNQMEWRKSVMSQIVSIFGPNGGPLFDNRSPHMFVGLSATPFDIAESNALWIARQKLTEDYIGFNYFNGELIDPTVDVKPPRIMSLSDAGDDYGLTHFSDIGYQLGLIDKSIFPASLVHARYPDGKTNGSRMSTRRLRALGQKNILNLLDATLGEAARQGEQPVGALLRLGSKGNDLLNEVLENIGADDPDFPYNVIRTFNLSDDDVGSRDMESLIERNIEYDPRPYIVVVSGKGRMGDKFPASCRFGIDLTKTASDMNALLQGVCGRMCGFGKKDPVVIVADRSATILNDYVLNKGRVDTIRQSRHTQTINPDYALRPLNDIIITDAMISAEPKNSPLRLLRDVIVRKLDYLEGNPPSKDAPHRPRGHTYIAIPKILRETNLIDYIEKKSMDLVPDALHPIRILGLDETITYRPLSGEDEEIGYLLNPENPDECYFLVRSFDTKDMVGLGRTSADRVSQGPIEGRTRERLGKRGISPMIILRKVDENGNTLTPHDHGRFVFHGISMDLSRPLNLRPQLSRNGERMNVPVVNHALRASVLDHGQKAGQLVDLMQAKIDLHANKKGTSVLSATQMQTIIQGDAMIRRSLASLYNPESHQLEILGGTKIQIVDKKSKRVDNPHGPAIFTFLDKAESVMIYVCQGRKINSLQEYESKSPTSEPKEQEPEVGLSPIARM